MADIVIESWEQLQELYQTLDPLSLQSILTQIQQQIDYKTRDAWGSLVNAVPPADLDSTQLSEEQIGLKWYCEHCGSITVINGDLSITFDQFANFGDSDENGLFETEATIGLTGSNEEEINIDGVTDEVTPAAEEMITTTTTQSTITIDPDLLETITLDDLLELEQGIITEQNEDNGLYWIKMVQHIRKYINLYDNHNIIFSNLEGQQIVIDINADFGIDTLDETPTVRTTNVIIASIIDTTAPPDSEEPELPPDEEFTENVGQDTEGTDNMFDNIPDDSDEENTETEDESFIGDDTIIKE